MGMSMSWIAAKGAGRAAILGSLGLAETGAPALKRPLDGRFNYSAFEHGGWLIVLAPDMGFASRERVAAASHAGVAIGAYLEEHVMVSGAFGASDGKLVWSVQHDPDQEPDHVEHLDVWGEPPAALQAIHTRLLQAQQDDDEVDQLFDAPAEVAASVCRFNPNDFNAAVETVELTPVQRLRNLGDHPLSGDVRPSAGAGQPATPRKPGFLARLFGAR